MADPRYSWVDETAARALAMDLIRGRGVASVRASGSDELLSVRGVNTQHLMLHARKAHWQTPVTEAPLLFERSLVSSDPSFHRARRPLIMMMRSLASLQGECWQGLKRWLV